jgi:hypothetical protein
MTFKKLILVIAIAMILTTGCVSCIAAKETIVQKKIIGIIEKVEHKNYLLDGEAYTITLTDGANLHFVKKDHYPDYILVQDWKEIENLTIGKEYQFLMEKDKSCNCARPWTLINITEI